MARLPKKKAGGGKKKKKTQTPEAGSSTESGREQMATLPVADGSANGTEEEKKKPARTPKKSQPAAKAASPKEGKNFLDKSIQFLREVKIELKKVTWPTRKQTIGSTVVVIILVMIISFFLGVVDIGLSSLVRVVLQ
jgi:preprotein translocase subunit SecE